MSDTESKGDLLIDLGDDSSEVKKGSPKNLTSKREQSGSKVRGDENPKRERQTGERKESPSPSLGETVSLNSNESTTSSDNHRRLVPWVNCQEKIILCIDLSCEMNEKSLHSRSAPDSTAYQFVRKASKMFVKNKSMLNSIHEFGVVVLEDDASWYQQFESNPDMICTVLDHLHPNEQENQETFQMERLFETISQRISLPTVDDLALPPPYTVRVILLYGRSKCIPVFSEKSRQILHTLLQSPYFFFDVLYVHEIPSENNKCEAIYDCFCELDEEEVGYMLEVSRSTSRLFDHMAALLAHPLQRPKQRDTFYELQSKEEKDT